MFYIAFRITAHKHSGKRCLTLCSAHCLTIIVGKIVTFKHLGRTQSHAVCLGVFGLQIVNNMVLICTQLTNYNQNPTPGV